MSEVNDILLSAQGDLDSFKGDFIIGESDQQHVEDILSAGKGEYKQSPLIGVGVINYYHGPLSGVKREKMRRDILLQLESDGVSKPMVSVDVNGEITVNGKYKI